MRNPIDAFVLQRLEREALKPSPEADKATLLRRVSLDLIGSAADAGGARRVSEGHVAERVREGRRSVAALAAVWRAHGVPLARCRALCRHQRLSDRRRAVHVAVARLGDRRVQSQHALRSVHDRATGRRLAAQRHAGPEDRHRVQSQSPRQLGRRHRARRVRRRIRRRSRGHDVHGVPGPDGRVRAMPQPQVRSVHAEGVLSALRVFQQRARARQIPACGQLAAVHGGAASGAGRAVEAARRGAGGCDRGLRKASAGGGASAARVGAIARQVDAGGMVADARTGGPLHIRQRSLASGCGAAGVEEHATAPPHNVAT